MQRSHRSEVVLSMSVRSWTARWGVVLALVLALVAPLWAEAPQLRVTFLDVGQGDAVLVRTADKTVLIDGGDTRFGSGVVVPYLKEAGIKKLDQVVISHPHRDHFGGLPAVISEIPVGEVVYSKDPNRSETGPEAVSGDAKLYAQLVELIQSKKIAYRQLDVGDKLNWGSQVNVEVMHTREKVADASAAIDLSDNEHSLIIKATAGRVSYLFTGDAEILAETSTANQFGARLKSTVLKSGHHGSKTSSWHQFMDRVKPEYAVISVGTGNSFGHPSPETFDTYSYYNVKTFRTDQEGTIDSFCDGQTVRFTSNQTPLQVTVAPKVLATTMTSATIQWETSKPANTEVHFGAGQLSDHKQIANAVTVHTVTLTGLKPGVAYTFQVTSRDARQPEQVVTATGKFKTPASPGVALPTIASIKTSPADVYVNDPFAVTVTVANPADREATDLSIDLYHTAVTPATALGHEVAKCGARGKATGVFPVTLTWTGTVEVFAVLKQGDTIIDTAGTSLTIEPKLMLIDAEHGNFDWNTGRFAAFKMDLARHCGIECKPQTKALTRDALKRVFVLVIPDIPKHYSAAELSALKEYVARGGTVWLFSRANYNDASHPDVLNQILQGVGSRIRFNNDEVCDPTNNLGKPWTALIHTFPSPAIHGIKEVPVRSCCSLLNAKMTGLAKTKTVELFATGDNDSYQLNLGTSNKTYYYGSHTPVLPIPIAAGEDIGLGRVAACGESMYDGKRYGRDAANTVPVFNQRIVRWLLAAREKSLADRVAELMALDDIDDADLRATRYEVLSDEVRRQSLWYAQQGRFDVIRRAFKGAGAGLAEVRRNVRDDVRFHRVHEGNAPELQQFLDEF